MRGGRRGREIQEGPELEGVASSAAVLGMLRREDECVKGWSMSPCVRHRTQTTAKRTMPEVRVLTQAIKRS